MPVVAAPLFGFSFGVVFAWAATAEIARAGGSVTSRTLLLVVLFGLLVYGPACAYLAAFFPDWSYAYFFDVEKRPPALDAALVLVDAGSAPTGFVLLARAASAGRTPVLARYAAVPAFVAAAFLLLLLGRLRVYGTYAQFHGDFGTTPATGSAVGWAVLWMSAVALGAAAWTVHVLRRFSEPESPR